MPFAESRICTSAVGAITSRIWHGSNALRFAHEFSKYEEALRRVAEVDIRLWCSATITSPDQRQLLFPILSDAVARSRPDQEGLGGRDGRTSEEADGGVEQAREGGRGGRPRRNGPEDGSQRRRVWEVSIGAETAGLVVNP